MTKLSLGIHAEKEIADVPAAYLQGIVREFAHFPDDDVRAAHDELWRRVRAGDWRIQVPSLPKRLKT